MQKNNSIISNFSSGEVSPKLAARIDLIQYQSSCRTILNGIVTPQGGVEKRPGTYFVNEVKDSSAKTYLLSFKYSATDQYVLEVGNLYIRFYLNHSQVLSSGAPLEVVTPYLTSEIEDITIVQSADILYFAHLNHPPAKLSRYATGWVYEVITFKTGDKPIRNVSAGQIGCVRISSPGHGLASNTMVSIEGVVGVSQANGVFVINVIDVDTFDLIGSSLPGYAITNCESSNGLISIRVPGWAAFPGITGLVNIGGVEGTEEANGTWELNTNGTLSNSAFVNNYISGGWISLASSYGYISGGSITIARQITSVAGNTDGEIRVISPAHGYFTGKGIKIADVTEAPETNGTWEITVIDENTYDLDGSSRTTLAEYVSGGVVGIPKTITRVVGNGVILGGLIRITIASHGYTTGQSVVISSVGGTLEANGTWTITVIDDNIFDLNTSAFVNTYTRGGVCVRNQSITNAVDNGAGLVRITVVGHGYISGQEVVISGVVGTSGANGTWAITKITNDTFDLRGSIFNSTAVANGYSLGTMFLTKNNYPSVVSLFEQRLVWGSTKNETQTLWLSVTGDFENFIIGTHDDDSLSYTLNSDGVNSIRWMAPWNVLLLGTIDGEWRFGGATITDPLTPSSSLAKIQSNIGSAKIKALLVGDLVIYIQYYGQKVYQIGYDFIKDSFSSAELTKLASHIGQPGIGWMVAQGGPETIICMGRRDGVIANMTFYTEEKIIAFSRTATQGLFESGAQIRGLTEDEIWVIVNRGGKRYVEYFMPRDFKYGETGLRPYPYHFVDSGLSFDGGDPVTITGITQANPVVVSYSGSAPTNGWSVKIEGAVGMEELNDNTFVVAGVSGHTFQLSGVDGTDFAEYISGGTWKRVIDSVSGLDHHEGYEVDICADGNPLAAQTVLDGEISLGEYYNRVTAGLHYDFVLEPQPIEINMQFGTSVGITKRVEKLTAMFHDTVGCKAGRTLDDLQDVVFPLNSGLFTGDVSLEYPGDYDTKVLLSFLHDEPLPCCILGVVTLMSAGER